MELQAVPASSPVDVDIDAAWEGWCERVNSSVAKVVPVNVPVAKRPWISSGTLRLISAKRSARENGNWPEEKRLRKTVQVAVRKDKADWLENLVASQGWNALKKGPRKQEGRLKNCRGELVDSDLRAETFAEHLENIQWRVRPATLIPDLEPPLRAELPVSLDPFTMQELEFAVARLAPNKATKQGDIPSEVFKALLASGSAEMLWVLDFCNRCLEQKTVPQTWSTASMALIFKKGDPAECDNYRPISILCIAYKMFAAMLKNRLVGGGVLGALWKTQFGFRPRYGTEDAIYIARRHVENACAARFGQIKLLALDWKKAFDSVHVDSLLDALRRFGLPQGFVHMIGAMMRSRHFFVTDCGETSALHSQMSGISQGCTLSPLIFVILMSVLMHDALSMLQGDAREAFERGDLADVVYADDTLLMGVSTLYLTEYMQAVAAAGRKYGMELHYGKFQLLGVRCNPDIRLPDNTCIQTQQCMMYLGTMMTADGKHGNELSRRIGIAKSDFAALQKVWKHSSLHYRQKVQIYKTVVESRLLYSLCALVLTKQEKRRLDGFQNRCLRSILGIQPSFLSRTSNAEVWQRSAHVPMSKLLERKQLLLLGKILRCHPNHPLRQVSFEPGTYTAATSRYLRRVGRPRKEWIPEVFSLALSFTGSTRNLLFPTCQVRVVRFYLSCLLLLLLSSSSRRPPPLVVLLLSLSSSSRCPPPPPAQLRLAIHSVRCRTSTTTIHAQCSLPDLNHGHPRPVVPAGPQPRPSTPSVPCRTSTASIHAKCSLPDLNHDHPRPVFPAGPQPRGSMPSVP